MKGGIDMKYYDPEYEREITEEAIRKQFEWFKTQPWFNKDYETFKKENFVVIDK